MSCPVVKVVTAMSKVMAVAALDVAAVAKIVAAAAEVLITEVKVVAPTLLELSRVHQGPLTANTTAPDTPHSYPSDQGTR